jgi:hypothetical protein
MVVDLIGQSQVEGMKDKHADGWAHGRTDMISRWAFLWMFTEV